MQKYREMLGKKDLRKTRYKLKIMEILSVSPSPISARGIIKNLSSSYKINLSTVYRILDELVKNNIAIKNSDKQGEYLFCLNKFGEKEIHGHLFCKNCQNFYCLEIERKNVMEFPSFSAEDINITISGVCKNCNKR